MKIRSGFVSNSSSSSFICEVCGETSSGWDLSYSEAEMCCCKNGHEMCEHHVLGENTIDFLQDEEREDYDEDWRYAMPIEYCPICQLKVLTDHDTIKFLRKVCGMSDEDILREVQNRFKTFAEFNAYLDK